jgi:uncharacterized membrane protein
MSAPDEDAETPRLTVTARALGWLAAQGASVGLLVWELHAWPKLHSYTTGNVASPRCRQHLLQAMAIGVGLAVVLATILVLVRRTRGLDLLHRVAHRTAPLCLLGLVPLLFDWELWVGRDLTFLVLASIFGLALQGLMRIALGTPPVFRVDWSRARALARRPAAILRWSGLPFLIACLAGAFCAVYFGYYTVVFHQNLHTSGYDLGIETNLVWNAAHGGALFRSTVLGGSMSHLGHHHTFFAYVLAPIFLLFPRPETLLIIQSVFMGAAAVALFLVARSRVGPWTACLVTCLLALYPPFHGAVLYDFHYQPLSTFFLLMALYLLEVRRDWWAALVIVLALSLREDIAALLAVLGTYLVITGRRPRAGLLVAAVTAVCFVAQKMIVMPLLHGGTSVFINQYEGLLPAGEHAFGGVLKTVLGNPAFTLNSLLEQQKLAYVLQIFAPLAFLPWRRPLGLLLFLPGFFFTLLATSYPALTQISFQYTAYWTPFVFLAAVDALAWIRGAGSGGALAKARSQAWLVAMTVAMLVCSNQHGAIFQHNTSRTGFDVFEFGRSSHDDGRHDDLYALIAQIPSRASVIATERVIPHVSSRPDAFNMRYGPLDAEYMLVGFPLRDDEKMPSADLLRNKGFGVVEMRGDFALAKRGHRPDRNAAVLARVGG